MKKHGRLLKGILITLVTIVLIITIPVVAVFGCLYVTDDTVVEVDEDFDMNDFISKMSSRSVDDSADTGRINFEISQVTLNSFLLNAVDEYLGDSLDDYLYNLYIEIDEDMYKFVVDLQLSFFKTQIVLYAELNDVREAENPSDYYFEFAITGLKLGKINGLDSLAKRLLSQIDLGDTIQSALSTYGISAQVDLDNLSIKYTYSALFDDIEALTTSTMSSSSDELADIALYFDILHEFMYDGLIQFNFFDNHAMHIYIDLEELSSYNDSKLLLNLDIDTLVKEKVETLYNNNPSLSSDDVINYFNYFFHGYDYVDSDIQSLVDKTNFSCFGNDFDAKAYEGLLNHNVESIEDNLANQVIANPLNFAYNITSGADAFLTITETAINQTIHSMDDFMGYTQLLYRFDDGELVCNYITLNEFYMDLHEDAADIGIGMSVNGYQIFMVFDTLFEQNENNPYQLNFIIDDITIGSIDHASELQDALLRILSTALTTDSNLGMSSYEQDGKTVYYFSVDFSTAIDDEYQALIESTGREIEIRVEDTSDGGDIELWSVESNS